jgi:hypothetical protein
MSVLSPDPRSSTVMPQPDRAVRPPVTCVPVADPFAFDDLRFRHGFSRGRLWALEDEPSVDERDVPSTAGERSDDALDDPAR